MTPSTLDWAIIVAYFIVPAAIGLWYAARGSRGVNDYFLTHARAVRAGNTSPREQPVRHLGGLADCWLIGSPAARWCIRRCLG